MAQFDVFENPDKASQAAMPYVMALQSNLTRALDSTIVAPLVRKTDPTRDARLQTAVIVNGEPVIVLFSGLTAVRSRDLQAPIARLPELRDVLMKAVDLLFLGF